MADGPYLGDILVYLTYSNFKATWKVVTRKEEKGFKVMSKLWNVERSISWFNWYRRMSKDYEAYVESSEAWIQIVSIGMMIKKI